MAAVNGTASASCTGTERELVSGKCSSFAFVCLQPVYGRRQLRLHLEETGVLRKSSNS